MLGEKSIISLKYYFYSVLPSMGASRVKMYCDEIVISDAIIRTVNLDMTLFLSDPLEFIFSSALKYVSTTLIVDSFPFRRSTISSRCWTNISATYVSWTWYSTSIKCMQLLTKCFWLVRSERQVRPKFSNNYKLSTHSNESEEINVDQKFRLFLFRIKPIGKKRRSNKYFGRN